MMRLGVGMLLTAVLILAGLSANSDAETVKSGIRNVLFIACDDLRNDLGCYGHTIVKTPNIDRLAKRGMLFENAFCQQAVCNPSRASLLTGMRPDRLRVWDLPTHFRSTTPDAITLPQHFKNNGYFVQNVGKIFHNFRQTIEGDPDSWSVPAEMHYTSHGKDTPRVKGPLPPNTANDPKCMCLDVPDEAYFDGRIASLAVKALQSCSQKTEPFFLAVGFWKPHSPFNAPKKYWDLYRREDIDLPNPAAWPTDAPAVARHDSRELLGTPPRELTREAILEMRHGYLANISYLDAQVGRVIDELDRLKLADTTSIVFWSDHGYHLGEQTLWAKTSTFELDARVPMFIVAPGVTKGNQSTPSIVELIDLYPTLVELSGLPTAPGLDGTSVVPILRDPKATVKSSALTQHPRPAYYDREPNQTPSSMGYSIRTSDFRYSEWRDWSTGKTLAVELYDLREGRVETQNVASSPQFADQIARCKAELDQHRPIVHAGWTPIELKSVSQ